VADWEAAFLAVDLEVAEALHRVEVLILVEGALVEAEVVGIGN
jgi:hypothetical protein